MKEIKFILNGKEVSVEADPLKRLLDVLREDNRMTGVKEGCGEGECGACAVLKDGVLVNSCMIPLGAAEGSEIVTPEGIRETEKGKCIIDSFGDAGAVQCGFCTPGMIMTAKAILDEKPCATEEEIREGIHGNICRCTGYIKIVEAIESARDQMRKTA